MKLDLDLWQKNIDFKEILQKVPSFMMDLQSFFHTINNYTKELIEYEIRDWEKDSLKHLTPIQDYFSELEQIKNHCNHCSESEAVLRLGHGSGWLFMTGGWVKNENFINDELYYKIEDKTRPNNRRYKD